MLNRKDLCPLLGTAGHLAEILSHMLSVLACSDMFVGLFDSAEAGLCTQFAQLAFTLLSCKVIHECSGTLCAGAVQRRLCSFPAAEAYIQELLTQGTTGSVLLWKPARISFVADSSMQRKLHQQQMPLAHENGSFLPPWCWYRVCEQPSRHGKRTAENLGACFSHSVRGLLAN